VSETTLGGLAGRMPKFIRRADPAVLTAFACIVILLGQIDLSVPWSVAAGAMMACAAAAYGSVGVALAIPFGVLCGVAIGIVNGIGVAYLRIPSMIITLATNAVAQGLMVVYTGGFSPQDSATAAMRYLATGFTIPGVPNAVIIWALIGAAMVFVLTRTSFGRAVYGIGNRERAAYLSGIDTRRIVMIAFAVSGGLSAFGGVLLAGYASKAAQSMGDAYLLPSIAAVVLGGTSILGGRGSYLGTVAGVILITLLQSILSVMQMPEAGRQIIYGVVIVAMLLLYGRAPASR
jgi:ribose transport system permease protein